MERALSTWRVKAGAETPALKRSARLDGAGWCALSLLLGMWIATLLATPAIPLQDVPDWIYQGWLLDRLLAGDPIAAGVEFKPYPVPNTLVTVLASLLVPWVGADFAGRALAIGAIAVMAIGAAAVAHAHRAGGWVATLLFASIGLSTPFLLGYLSFVLSFGLLGLALAADRAAPLNWRAILGWSLLLFFTHAIAFGVFVLAIGWRHVALLRLRASAVALLPSLACALWYAAVRLLEETAWSGAELPADGVLVAAWEQLRWKPFTAAAIGGWRELRVGDAPLIPLDALGTFWMIAFNLLFAAALAIAVALAVRTRLMRRAIAWTELIPIAALLVLFVAAPPIDFFGIINVGERFWLAACLLLVPLARPRPAFIAALMIASVPAHALNLASMWRAGVPDAAPHVRSEPPTPWHPFIVQLAGRAAVIERIGSEVAPRIDSGYATGILRNR